MGLERRVDRGRVVVGMTTPDEQARKDEAAREAERIRQETLKDLEREQGKD